MVVRWKEVCCGDGGDDSVGKKVMMVVVCW